MFLMVQSKNPKFSWIISKNPETGMLIKEVRQGKLFGWFYGENRYNCWFKDAENEMSYKNNPEIKFEYVDTTRYNSAMGIVNILTETFKTCMQNHNEEDVEDRYHHVAVINMCRIRSPRYLELFQEHFTDYSFTCEEIAVQNYRISIGTNKSIHHLMNMVNLFAITNALRNDEIFMFDGTFIEKYLNSLNVVDAPYFIRYLFKINFIKSKKNLEQYRSKLEDCKRSKIHFEFGNTEFIRRNAVESELDFKSSIIDIGCGRGYMAFPFAKKIGENEYYAIDIDPDKIERITKLSERKKIENIVTLNKFEEFLEKYEDVENCDVLMCEVIEHMEKKEAARLLRKVLKWNKWRNIIITTPNKSFNKNYLFDEGETRHETHVFEMTQEEFNEWLSPIIGTKTVKFFSGKTDIVENEPATIFCKIFRGDK